MEGSAPKSYKRMMVVEQTFDYRKAVAIVETETPDLKDTEVLVKNRYLGVNASDKPFAVGRYYPDLKPPYPCGFEAVGEIVMKGSQVQLPLHQPVAYVLAGAFSEYCVIDQGKVTPIPELNKDFISLIVCGATAGLVLEFAGELKLGEKVLVTAAAGGTGQFAVQLAKRAGCHVIGTCGSQTKVELLRRLGCDRVINYNEEKLANVLKAEYPKGVDMILESVGGTMFDTCVRSLAVRSRLVVIGWISSYHTENGYDPPQTLSSLPRILLSKSASIRAFALYNHMDKRPEMFRRLAEMRERGEIECVTDTGELSDSTTGPFEGLEGVYDAIDYLYSKKSVGKVVVQLSS